jgi:hypothetical protein
MDGVETGWTDPHAGKAGDPGQKVHVDTEASTALVASMRCAFEHRHRGALVGERDGGGQTHR